MCSFVYTHAFITVAALHVEKQTDEAGRCEDSAHGPVSKGMILGNAYVLRG